MDARSVNVAGWAFGGKLYDRYGWGSGEKWCEGCLDKGGIGRWCSMTGKPEHGDEDGDKRGTGGPAFGRRQMEGLVGQIGRLSCLSLSFD